MKEVLQMVVFGFFCIILFILGVWTFQGNDFFMYKFFAPKYEDARREVFENTKSFRDGMITELESMQHDYAMGNTEQKAALKPIILRRAAQIDPNDLPPHVRSFVDEIRKEY